MNFNLFKKTRPESPTSDLKMTSDSLPYQELGDGDLTLSGSGLPFAAGNMLFGQMKYAYYYTLWRFFWEANKAVNIPPKDMIREGWEYKGADVPAEDLKKIEKYETLINLREEIFDALVYERLYGGGVVLLGTSELNTDASTPLLIKNIGKEDLRFVRAFSRLDVSGLDTETDPLSPNYNRPKSYYINGQEVHRSRLLIFDGGGQKSTYNFSFTTNVFEDMDSFGYSILEPVYDDIIRANGTRQAAYHLANMLSIPMFKKKLQEGGVPYSEREAEIRQSLKEIMKQMNNYNGVILDTRYELEKYQSDLQKLPELIIEQLQVLSAGVDIPAPRYLGQAPGGLNATGKGDLTNYYNSIGSDQVIKLKPRLEKIKPLLIQAAGLSIDPEAVQIEFKPLTQLTEQEQAEIREKDTKNITSAIDAGIGGQEWAREESTEREIFLNTPIPGDNTKKE